MEQYRDFAFVYDELMNEVDYNGWVKYIEDIIKNENAQVQNILELACGTGNLTIPLTKKNYDIAGIDISEEMLSVAREKAEKEGVELVLLQQDIAELDFDVPNLDCILCACDGFNYLTYDDELESVFEKSYELLKDDGVFIFDISSYYKLSTILGNNMYVENREDVAYMWQNYFDSEENVVEMELAFFIKEEDGRFTRFEEVHQQRAYTEKEVLKMLKKAGFTNAVQSEDVEASLSLEQLVEIDPDIIVYMREDIDTTIYEEWKDTELYKSLKSVKNNEVYVTVSRKPWTQYRGFISVKTLMKEMSGWLLEE